MTASVTFAIPGDIETLTGGYIYEKNLLLALRRIGVDVAYLKLPGGFPDPAADVIARTADALAALPAQAPVILDGFLPGAMPPEALARMRAPFVAVTHHPLAYETGLDPARAAYLKQVEATNLARAAHVIVPSPHTARMLVDDFEVPANRITIAPPGLERPQITPGQKPPRPQVLVVGQIVPRKGHDTVLRALHTLRHMDWQAHFVGRVTDPGHARDLHDLARHLGIAERVEFTGEVQADRLARYYAQASVFALATHYEGYGMVFAEAMAHGLPIVTCDGGAVAQTVPPDAGLIVPVGDAAAFGDAVRAVLADAALRGRLARASARHGRALPNWEATAGIVAQVLRAVTVQD